VTPDNCVRSEILAARERGVIFDIGHGGAAFGFATARAMLDAGFLPDVISSDAHVLSVQGPAFNLLHTMSKFLALGMELNEVIRRTTIGPAKAVRRPGLGTLTTGSTADITILKVLTGEFEYRDSLGERIIGRHALQLRGIVMGGRWWHPEKSPWTLRS